MSNFKRLTRFAILPNRGETAENILEFNDVWNVDFGDVGIIKQHMGDSRHNKENPQAVCIHFRTGNTTEVEVGFRTTQTMYGFIIGAKRNMILSDHPWAKAGDEGNIKEALLGDHTQSVVTYVSNNNRDPRGSTKGSGYGPDGKGVVETSSPPRPNGTGLKPNTDYYVTHRYVDKNNNPIPQKDIAYPMTVTYVGTDDPENGGEQIIATLPVYSEPGAPPATDDLPMVDSIEITIAGVRGMWTPID